MGNVLDFKLPKDKELARIVSPLIEFIKAQNELNEATLKTLEAYSSQIDLQAKRISCLEYRVKYGSNEE